MRKPLGVLAAVVVAACGAAPQAHLAGGCQPVAVGGWDVCRQAVQAADAVLVPALFPESGQQPGQQIVGEEHHALVLAGGV